MATTTVPHAPAGTRTVFRKLLAKIDDQVLDDLDVDLVDDNYGIHRPPGCCAGAPTVFASACTTHQPIPAGPTKSLLVADLRAGRSSDLVRLGRYQTLPNAVQSCASAYQYSSAQALCDRVGIVMHGFIASPN